MIPGFIITWLTFPGVIVHELAHALFCRLFGLDIYAVQYFQFSTGFGQPAGYVIHRRAKHAWQDTLVGIGPFFVNTILGAVIAAPAAIPVLKFHGGDVLDWLLMWLGVSIAMHSFPSTGDAASIWSSVTDKETPIWTKALGIPIVGVIYLGALASIFWLDLLYGVAVAGFLPGLLVNLLA
ncbi:metalloprotease family protein [Fimbriimonas ginsengisoli]|uniref:Zincin peptidase n=1 Tax=Fimbriimonas ginsengisoli Gsoil 348 TaxID=661478 RepID=A0A068NRH8_FIMGI|nr:metalloprotease family protein [Fimbriimonas ginsengisoli]AIE84204.1 hypothetical protein OP10G_0836 [Fimbriimonas ginsengisoli Gsoil 348]